MKVKRFVTEYANFKIDEILKNEFLSEDARQKAISKIDKAHFLNSRGLIPTDEAIKTILNCMED